MKASDIPALSEEMDQLLGGVTESQRAEMVRRFKAAGRVIHPRVIELVQGMVTPGKRKDSEKLIAHYAGRALNQPKPDYGFFAQIGVAKQVLKEEKDDAGGKVPFLERSEREMIARAFRALHWVVIPPGGAKDIVGWDGVSERVVRKGYQGGAPTNSELSEYLVRCGVSVGASVKAFDKRVREAVELLELDAIREAIRRLAPDAPRTARVNPATGEPAVWPPECRGALPDVEELFSFMADGCGWRRRWESADVGDRRSVEGIKELMAAEIARNGGA